MNGPDPGGGEGGVVDGAEGAGAPGGTVAPETIERRLAAVRERMARAAAAAGRDPASVLLIGITKTHPPEVAAGALSAGLLDLGENRVDELVAKSSAVPGARWHLVGRLQSNKVRDAVGRAVLLHAVDRPGLVDAVSRRASALGIVQAVLVQVNVGEDPAKGGCRLSEADGLVAYARQRPGVRVEGLMTVPPLPPPGGDPTAAARPYFAALRELRDRLGSEPVAGDVPGGTEHGLHLSMGMSDDLEAAVAEGATMVRIGTALFGHRPEQGARVTPSSGASEPGTGSMGGGR